MRPWPAPPPASSLRRPARAVLSLAAALASVLGTRPAHAWQEAHEIGDDVRVRVDPAGSAQVEHMVRWHVVRGPFRSVDLVSVDPAAVLDPDVSVTGEDGRTLMAHATRRDERTVHVATDDPRALMRGTFTFAVRWRVDLVASHALVRDGGTFRLGWSSPVATEGFDGARTVFELPAAPDAPVAVVADTGAVDETAVSSLHREAGADVLELVRPHVARGEAPVWTLRLDPRALPLVADPALRRPSEAPAPEPDRVHEATGAAALGALALLFGLLVHGKARSFGAACAERGVSARGLVPLPGPLQAAVAGLALAAGVALQTRGDLLAGAALVALATVSAALRAPAAKLVARGPGRWLALSREAAFPRAGEGAGARLLAGALAVAALGAVALVARRFDPGGPWLVAIDACALVPLVLTGRAGQLPPRGAGFAAPWLERLLVRLEGLAALRTTPWARVPVDSERPDEVRLLVLPRAPMPGLVGVEVALAWSHTPTGWTHTPEVLARVLDGSAAATRLARELPGGRIVPGRRPEERVLRLVPRYPTGRHALAVVRAVCDALADRRVVVGGWAGLERRGVALPSPAGAAG